MLSNLITPPSAWNTVTELGGADATFNDVYRKKPVWGVGFRVSTAGDVAVRLKGNRVSPGDAPPTGSALIAAYKHVFTAVPAGGSVSCEFDQIITAGTTVAAFATTGMDIAIIG